MVFHGGDRVGERPISKHYGEIAFTDAVRDVQDRYGSGAFYRSKMMRARAAESPDALTEDAREFLGQRDGFYLATVRRQAGRTSNSVAAPWASFG